MRDGAQSGDGQSAESNCSTSTFHPIPPSFHFPRAWIVRIRRLSLDQGLLTFSSIYVSPTFTRDSLETFFTFELSSEFKIDLSIDVNVDLH